MLRTNFDMKKNKQLDAERVETPGIYFLATRSQAQALCQPSIFCDKGLTKDLTVQQPQAAREVNAPVSAVSASRTLR